MVIINNMGWLGNACKCKCGWACDQINESDTIRVCEKCEAVFDRRSYGWCLRGNKSENDENMRK